jgi:hypothetical protein
MTKDFRLVGFLRLAEGCEPGEGREEFEDSPGKGNANECPVEEVKGE